MVDTDILRPSHQEVFSTPPNAEHLTDGSENLSSATVDEILDLETAIQFDEELIQLASDFEMGKGAITFGPEFIYTLKNGDILHIHLIMNSKGIHKPGSKSDRENSRFVLLAVKQSTSEVVGFKWGTVNRSEQGKTAITGKIQVAHKGMGIGSAIEAANQVVIQSIADTEPSGVKVFMNVSNENADRMQGWIDLCGKSTSPTIVELLRRKVLEQARWQAIYGPGGHAGVSSSKGKEIPPVNAVGALGEDEVIYVQTAGKNQQPVIFGRGKADKLELQNSFRVRLVQDVIDRGPLLEQQLHEEGQRIKTILSGLLGISSDDIS